MLQQRTALLLFLVVLFGLSAASTEKFNKWKANDPKKVLPINLQKKPFLPFSDVGAAAGPLIRPDGTTKSRDPEDTLSWEELPSFEVGFTSLEKHLKETLPGKTTYLLQGPNGDLGNLDPREVFYADDDLLIIKGGGFHVPTYEEPNQDIQPEEQFNHRETFDTQPPNPHEEYNGNIPTIIKPPRPTPRRIYPSRSDYYSLSLFMPAQLLTSSDSEVYYTYVPINYHFGYYYPVPPYPYWMFSNEHFTYETIYPPPSLIDDTRVNYLNPLPPTNPDAEVIEISRPFNHNRNSETYIPRNKKKYTKPLL